MPRILAGVEFVEHTLPDGVTPNPIRQEVLTMALRALFQQNENVVEIPIKHGEYSPAQLVAILDAGGEVLDFPAWLEFATAAELEAAVPSYLPGALDEGVPVTWRQWCGVVNPPFEAGGKWYVGTNYRDGVDLAGSVLRQLQLDGYTIRLPKAMRAIVRGEG